MRPADFWPMSLAEWRAMIDGYAQRTQATRRQAAWSLSYQLIAAGCDADKVTPAKLLGEKEPRRRAVMDHETRKLVEAKKIAERFKQKVEAEQAAKGEL